MWARKIIVIFVILILWSCNYKKGNSELLKQFPEIEKVSEKLKFVFTNGFNFTDDIRINEIAVQSLGTNKYRVIYFLDEENDFTAIGQLNIAFRVYPESPELFQNEKDKNTRARTIATKGKVKRMGNKLVIASETFSIVPKKFKETKVYFYRPESGVLGKPMTILGMNLEF